MFPLPSLSRCLLKAVLFASFTASSLHAAPYGPNGMEIEWTQPSGAKIPLRVFGDEFYGRTETLDGYTVVFDAASKTYKYATASADGQELVATGMVVGQGNPQALGLAKNLDVQPAAKKAVADARFEEWDQATGNSQQWANLKAQRQAYEDAVKAAKSGDGPMPAPPSFTTIGDKKGLTLLIDFSDAPSTIPQASVIDYCNGDNYTGYSNNGSVKKYFQDNSKNLLTYTNTVTAYIRMAQPKSYYNDTAIDSGLRGRLLINDAIDIMKALPNYNSEILPTFNDLTVDGSNRAVACNVFFAGGNSGVWSYGLWPHSWSLSSAKELSPGGKKVFKYQITNLGNSLTLGTFCHENGHMLCGYPDIYDYDYDSKGGAGVFCLMNSGGNGTNPVLINAYLRRASGWTTTTDLTSSSDVAGTLVSTVGHADFNKIYRYPNPAAPTTEYFLFENRQKTGRDANISASGIAIWHIDQLGDHNDQRLAANTAHDNYEVSLIQADNLWQLQSNTNNGDSKDLFYLGNTAPAYTNSFNDNSSPDAKWWSGAASGLNVYNISASGAAMTLQFGLPPNTISVLAPNGGEQVYFSTTQEIRWTSNTPGNVQIELYKGGVPQTVLSASETNDGSFSWSVSAALPAGNDYTIKISSVATPAFTDSSNAAFSILTAPTLADSLDTTGLTWTNSGNANWIAQPATTHDGVDAAQSGAIDHNQNSHMETTLTGPGDLSFWWKVSSESNYDYLRFYLDGTEQTGSLAKISGSVEWTLKTVAIPAGVHIVKWGYTKDGSIVSNADAAWVDQVVYTPSAAPEIAVEQPADANLVDGVASIDCGVFNLSSASPAITFTVKNTGAADLTGLSLSKDGSHSSDFTLGALAATTVVPGGSTTFTVTFSPSVIGARTAAIHLASNDSNENPFDIALTGTGVTVGTLVVTPAGNLTSSGSFGGLFSPTSLQFTLSNPGTTSLEWTAAKSATWVDLNATNGTLAAGDSTILTGTINSTADALAVNGYSDTVVFTNITNGNGNTTRGLTLNVNPIPATVTLSNLAQTYDTFQKEVSVTTNPPGLDVAVTYDEFANPPSNAGTYSVVATITTPNYSGSDSKDFVISKASQAITFAALDPVPDNAAPFALTATASSMLAVSYASSNTAVATVSGDTVTIVGLGTTTITASQTGNVNYAAATPVPQTLTVVRSNPLAAPGGPYKLLVGQSLSLNGSGSQPSHPESLTTYQWDLNNDDIFTDATGATPTAITFATLTSTWGMIAGLNPIKLKVTDSADKTSIVSTTVELVLSLTWDANGTTSGQSNGTGAWLAGNLWWDGTSNQTWASGSNATLGGPNTAGAAVTLASPTSVNAITLNAFTGTYTLGSAGQAITLNGGITKNAASAAATFVSPISFSAAQTWTNNSTSAITAGNSANLITNHGHQLTLSGSGPFNFNTNDDSSNTLTGSGAIIKEGSGVLLLRGVSNSFSGAITVNGGSIITGVPASLGTGNLKLNGGVHEARWNNAFIRSLGAGAGQLQITGGVSGFSLNGNTGTNVILGNNNSIEAVWGSTHFDPSILVLQNSNAQGTSALTFQNKIDLNGTSRAIQVSGGVLGTATATISGIIRNSSGTAGITKTGNGQLTLSAPNTYNGITTISAGPVAISNASSLGTAAGNTTIAATGSINGAHLKISNNLSLAENFTITGTTEANSYIAAISSTSGTNTLSGNIILSSPTAGVRLGAVAGTLTFSGNISQTTTTRGLAFIAGSGAAILVNNAIANNGGTLQIYNATQTTGTGTVTLKGVSGTGLGATDISQTGILKLGVTNALNTSANLTLGAVTTTAGHDIATFDLAGFNQTVNALIGSKNTSNTAADSTRKVTNSAAGTGTNTLTVGNGDGSGTFNGVIADGVTAKVALSKTGSGTQTLAGPNTYSGATTISGGTLALGNAASLADTTSVSLSNTATFDISAISSSETVGSLVGTTNTAVLLGTKDLTIGGNNTSDNFAGILSGMGSFSKIGAGTLTLSGENTYSGPTSIAAGTLAVTGSLGATAVTVSSPATLSGSGNIGGDVSIASGAHHALAVAATPGAQVARAITGTLTLTSGNILDLTAATPPADGIYVLATATTAIVGTPTIINDNGIGGTVSVDTVSTPKRLLLTISSNTYATWIAGFPGAAAMPGFDQDADGDGVKNGVENFFGTNPGIFTSGLLPGTHGPNTFTFTHPQNASPAGNVSAAYRWSKDLVTFHPSGATDGADTTVTFTTQLNTPSPGITTVTATVTGNAATKLLVDVQVIQN